MTCDTVTLVSQIHYNIYTVDYRISANITMSTLRVIIRRYIYTSIRHSPCTKSVWQSWGWRYSGVNVKQMPTDRTCPLSIWQYVNHLLE